MMLDGAKNLVNIGYKGLCAGSYDEGVTVMVDGLMLQPSNAQLLSF
jgi:hypothetical protein